MITEIGLGNVRVFRDRHLTLGPGLNEISLGPLGGKTTLIDAVQCALGLPDTTSYSLAGSGSSSITVKLKLREQEWTVTRIFDESGTKSWTATSPLTTYNLSDESAGTEWRRALLAEIAGEQFHGSMSSYFVRRYIDHVFSLILRSSSPASTVELLTKLFHPDLMFDLSTVAGDLASQLGELVIASKQRLVADRSMQTALTRQAEKIDEIDRLIKQGEERLTFLEKTLHRDEDEIRQAENIHAFISGKRREIQLLQFDIVQTENRLARGMNRVEEPAAITEKRILLEDLGKHEKNLDGRLREFHHLERNLRGISREVRNLSREDAADRHKLEVYEAEVLHIRELLSQNRHVDKELERVRSEKNKLVEELGPWTLAVQSDDAVTFDVDHLVQKLERCRAKKEKLETELEGINAAFYEERFKILQSRIFQHQQQIREQQQRLLDLDVRRLATLRGDWSEGTSTDIDSNDPLGTKRYLDVFSSIAGEVGSKLRQEATKGLADALRPYFSGREMEVFQLLLRGFPDDQIPLSGTERLLISEIIRAVGLGISSALRVYVADENAARLLDSNQLARLKTIMKSGAIGQAIILV